MPKFIVFVGEPGSGKSTIAAHLVEMDPTIATVERDWLRRMTHGKRLGTVDQENMISTIQQAAVKALLREGRDVIVSDTNLRWATIYQWQRIARSVGADLEIISLLDVMPATCAEQDAGREYPVGPEAIYGMWEKFIISTFDLHFAEMVRRAGHDQVLKVLKDVRWLETPDGRETYDVLLSLWGREFLRIQDGRIAENYM